MSGQQQDQPGGDFEDQDSEPTMMAPEEGRPDGFSALEEDDSDENDSDENDSDENDSDENDSDENDGGGTRETGR